MATLRWSIVALILAGALALRSAPTAGVSEVDSVIAFINQSAKPQYGIKVYRNTANGRQYLRIYDLAEPSKLLEAPVDALSANTVDHAHLPGTAVDVIGFPCRDNTECWLLEEIDWASGQRKQERLVIEFFYCRPGARCGGAIQEVAATLGIALTGEVGSAENICRYPTQQRA